ncbi:hypothetical protein DFR31_1058 [Alkalispirillum mobile]|uniref:Yip1-like protein n=1 Tax=Alkalispirillum mobile TaxID=85925 RepID=A0A498C637_9GAMM|nr:hypothetical protein [Alkalispirillum mobile]RLK51142.1 hypothetical protein DFR31_1058 [Alkalispirillum mobile]
MPFFVENLRALLRILVFRSSPADLSASPNLLVLLVAGSLGIGYLAAGILPGSGPVELQLLVAAGVTLGLVYLALRLRGALPRFNQTASAVFGTDLLLSIPMLGVQLQVAGADEAGAGLLIVALAIWAWRLAVLGFILSEAMDIRRSLGVLAAVAYMIIVLQIVTALD